MTITSRSRWKAIERDLALKVGGRRVPVSGRARGDAPDIEHPLFSFEVKAGARLVSSRIKLGLAQAKAAAKGTQKVPIVLLSESRLGHKGNLELVVMDLTDFMALQLPAENARYHAYKQRQANPIRATRQERI